MTEPREFTCPKCGGHHFGSDACKEKHSGQLVVGEMVTCQSIVTSKYIGSVKVNSYCGYRCTRKEGGL